MKFNIDPIQQIIDLVQKYNPNYIVLDCDGTLYPNIVEARKVFYESLHGFFYRKFGYSQQDTDLYLEKQKEKYTTVSEIAACLLSGIDETEFNEEVIRPMNLENLGIDVLSPWSKLKEYKIPLIIFTNNSSFFASLIASKVGIIGNVERIFGESELNFIRKPAKEVFRVVANSLPAGSRILFFDDDISCIKMGDKIGWNSVYTKYSSKEEDGLLDDKVLIIN